MCRIHGYQCFSIFENIFMMLKFSITVSFNNIDLYICSVIWIIPRMLFCDSGCMCTIVCVGF